MQGHAGKSNVKSNLVRKSGEKTETKVLKTSFVVVCVYMTCWTPLSVMGFIEVFGGESPRWAHLFAYYLVFCSSLTNPFIYGIMNPQFQQSFKKMFRLRVNDVQPISSRANCKETKSTALGSKAVLADDMPSTSINSVPLFRDQNHNASDTGVFVNGVAEAEEQSDVPGKSFIKRNCQAWQR